MKLEEKLVSLRKAKGLSQMKLAEKMNVSRQAISRWETGAAIPSSENLKYLSDLYSVSLLLLFYFGNMIFLIGQARNLLQMKQKPY